MSMLLIDVFDRSRTRAGYTWGSRADTHYHIVTTFEAKGGGAPGVLTQNLGISGRLEWLSEVCVCRRCNIVEVIVKVMSHLYGQHEYSARMMYIESR